MDDLSTDLRRNSLTSDDSIVGANKIGVKLSSSKTNRQDVGI